MKQTSFKYHIFLLVGTLAAMLLFAWIISWMYHKSKPTPDQTRALERAKILQTSREQQQHIATTAAWIDRDKKVVRLPMDLAMKLTLEELKQKPLTAKGLANPVPSAIVPPTIPASSTSSTPATP